MQEHARAGESARGGQEGGVTSHAYGIAPRPGFVHAPRPKPSVCTKVIATAGSGGCGVGSGGGRFLNSKPGGSGSCDMKERFGFVLRPWLRAACFDAIVMNVCS